MRAHLFENRKEVVAATRSVQQWQSPMTGTGDKVQVMRAVAAMRAAGHGKSYGIGSMDTRPCKRRKDGAPRFQNGKGKTDGRCGERRSNP